MRGCPSITQIKIVNERCPSLY